MRSHLKRSNLSLPKTNLAICKLDANLVSKETQESPRPSNISGRTTAVSNSPTFKVKKLMIPAFDKVTGKRKEPSPKSRLLRGLKVDYVPDSLETHNPRRDEFHGKHDELDSPPRGHGIGSGGSDLSPSPSPGHNRSSSVRIVSLNQQMSQMSMRQRSSDEERAHAAFQQKFTKKYNHFKRTQNTAFLHSLGRFKSIAEINERVNSIQVEAPLKKNFQDWENEIARACPTEREKAVLQRKVNQIVRLRRKILDGEIDFSKYCSEMDNKKTIEREQEKFSSARNLNLINPRNSEISQMTQGPVVVKAPSRNQSHRATMVTMQDSAQPVRGRSDNAKLETLRNLKVALTGKSTEPVSKGPSLVLNNGDAGNSKGYVDMYGQDKGNGSRIKTRVDTREVVNIHTERMKYRTQSLDVSLIADSRGRRSMQMEDTIGSPDRSLMETQDEVKVGSGVEREERSAGLPVIAKDFYKSMGKRKSKQGSVQESRKSAGNSQVTRKSVSKRNSMEDVSDMKVAGWRGKDSSRDIKMSE